MRLFKYTGTISVIDGTGRDIILGDVSNFNKPPVRLTVPCAEMAKYLIDRSWTDDEERYIHADWYYDRNLFLQYIEIPGDHSHIPAKVIASADCLASEQMEVFGEQDVINTDEPVSMSMEEFYRWREHRSQHF